MDKIRILIQSMNGILLESILIPFPIGLYTPSELASELIAILELEVDIERESESTSGIQHP